MEELRDIVWRLQNEGIPWVVRDRPIVAPEQRDYLAAHGMVCTRDWCGKRWFIEAAPKPQAHTVDVFVDARNYAKAIRDGIAVENALR